MWAARTGPAARSIRKPTISTFIRTQPCLPCGTSRPTSRCQGQIAREAYCARPPNPAKRKKERRQQAEVAEPQVVVPEDAAVVVAEPAAADLVVLADPVEGAVALT